MESVATPEVTTRSLVTVVESLRGLLSRDLPPQQFFQKILELLIEGDPEALAGMWMAAPTQPFVLFVEIGFAASGLLEDRLQFQSNQELLLKGTQSETPLLLPLNSQNERGQHQCLLVPVTKGGRRIGILQLLTSGLAWNESGGQELKAAEEMIRMIERFLNRSEVLMKALNPDSFHQHFAAFSSKLHQSLDPMIVGATAVNETCNRLGCERAWLFERRGNQWRINAVSGQQRIRQTSPQVRALRNLVRHLGAPGERFVFNGEELSLPQVVLRSLMTYLEESGVQMLIVEPLFAEKSADDSPSKTRAKPIGLLICEQFQDHLPAPGLIQHLQEWSEQIALAVRNARRHRQLLLLPGMTALSRAYEQIRYSRLAFCLAVVALLAGAVTGMTMVEQDLRIQSRGYLMPAVRRNIYSALDGEVEQVFVQESEVVEQGQPLLRLRSPQLELNELTLSSELQELLQNRDAVRAGVRTALTSRDRAESARQEAQVETLTIQINSLQQQLVLLAEEREKLIVVAPISGTVTTNQPQSRLLNRPVQRGEALLELMDESGPWRLELAIPERRAGHVLTWFYTHENTDVDFRMTVQPQQVLKGQLVEIGDRTGLNTDYGTVVHANCIFDQSQLPLQRIGADVSAQIHCGSKNLLFIYFGELWEFLQRQWWM